MILVSQCKGAKLSKGPRAPKPGPILPAALTVPVIAVTVFFSIKAIRQTEIAIIAK